MSAVTGADTQAIAEAPRDVFHVTRDAEYERKVRDEAAFWDQPQLFGVDIVVPETGRYQNLRHTGHPERAWHDTIAGYGDFRRGLSLGTSGLKLEASILRQNPNLHLTFCDISTQSLAQRRDELGRTFPGRVGTQEVDLNFAEFPAESYDLIVSSSSMHHITNLEHVAYQANNALTADGYLFLQDYVAESHFAFADPKKRVFEAALEEMRRRHAEVAGWRLEWPAPEDHSPFEAVRSDEILPIFRRYLREERLRLSGALLTLLLLLRYDGQQARVARKRASGIWQRIVDASRRPADFVPGDRSDLLRAIAPDLTSLDEVLCDAGILLPANAFAVYRKRA